MFNAEISAAIEENLAHTNYGDILAEPQGRSFIAETVLSMSRSPM